MVSGDLYVSATLNTIFKLRLTGIMQKYIDLSISGFVVYFNRTFFGGRCTDFRESARRKTLRAGTGEQLAPPAALQVLLVLTGISCFRRRHAALKRADALWVWGWLFPAPPADRHTNTISQSVGSIEDWNPAPSWGLMETDDGLYHISHTKWPGGLWHPRGLTLAGAGSGAVNLRFGSLVTHRRGVERGALVEHKRAWVSRNKSRGEPRRREPTLMTSAGAWH